MALVLVATSSGCRVFSSDGEGEIELPGRFVCAMARDIGGSCLAIVDEKEICAAAPSPNGPRSRSTDVSLASIASVNGKIYVGAMEEAAMFRISPGGEVEHLVGFDEVPGRSEWFANGPPLHVRAVTATADDRAILAAVHVGGIPRSVQRGQDVGTDDPAGIRRPRSSGSPFVADRGGRHRDWLVREPGRWPELGRHRRRARSDEFSRGRRAS